MSPNLLESSEDISGLYNILSTSGTPFDIDRILLLKNKSGLSTDGKLPLLRLDCATELAMGGITPEHINHVVEVSEAVIDGNIHFTIVKSNSGEQVSNTAKYVLGTWLALHKEIWLAVEWEGARRLNFLGMKIRSRNQV